MEVKLNGNTHSVTPASTVNDLIIELELEGKFAVEINNAIIPRSEHAATEIRPGDTIEVVQAIGGG